MKLLVVLFALTAVACGSYVPLAQPPHHPAVVLDSHGRPLDTAEVIGARALHLQAKALEHHAPLLHAAPLAHAYAAPIAHSYAAPIAHGYAAPIAHAVVAAPAAVSHQSRVDVHSSAALVAHAPVYGAHAAHGLFGHGHLLKKRSLAHITYATPVIAPSAVSHQSRIDVHSSPAIVSHAIAAPVLAHAVAAPVVAHAYAPSAVSHQSRVDYRSSPAIIGHSVYAAPTHAIYGDSFYGHGLSHAHFLKKRSLAHIAYATPVIAPSAVSHQSRVDVISSPAVVSHAVAAPIVAAPVVAHALPAAVSHQSRFDIRTSAVHVPVAHSAFYSAPVSHWGSFLHALHL